MSEFSINEMLLALKAGQEQMAQTQEQLIDGLNKLEDSHIQVQT